MNATEQTPLARPNLGKLAVRIETSFDALGPLRCRWDQLACEVGSPIYMSFDWLRIWWRHYGGNKALRIMIAEDGECLAAAIPMYVEVIGVWPLRMKVMKLVGANIPPKAFDPPVRPDCAREVFAQLICNVLTSEEADLLSFGPVSERWSGQQGFRDAAQQWVGPRASRWRPDNVLTIFHLPRTFEEYLSGLDHKERRTRSEKLRLLSRRHSVSVAVVSGSAANIEEFERFFEQHTAQWTAEGKGGHFNDWPRGIEFHRELAGTLGALDRLLFVKLLADGKVVANRYSYRFGPRIYSELPSRIASPEWDNAGLGTTALFKLIETAIGLGAEEIHSGIGHYEYKVRLKGDELELGTWRLVRSNWLCRLKLSLFLPFFRLIAFTSYHIWHRRVLPHLPSFVSRSQSLFLLRFDV